MNGSRTALITGASAGIGTAFAHEYAKNQHNLILVARREERLQEIAQQIQNEYDVEVAVIATDLAAVNAGEQITSRLAELGRSVDVLINNAGYGLGEGLLVNSWEDHMAMQQVMLTGYFELCYRLLPAMVERGYGRVINVSSLAAMMPAGRGHLYSAIKRYVNDMSIAIDYEFRDQGIHCCALCPGFTYTEFHDVMGVRDEVSNLPKIMWQSAAEVAAEGREAVEAGKVVHITGGFNRVFAVIINLMPRALQYHLARQQKSLSQKD